MAAIAWAGVAGCGGVSGLDPDAPHAVDLSGNWVIDHQASDDPQKMLDRLRPKTTNRREGQADDLGVYGNDSDQGDGQTSGGPRRRSQPAGPSPAMIRSAQIFTHTQVMRMLSADVARSEQVTIRQTPGQFTLDYGTSVRTFTPGLKSVVSASWGVADQSAGWKGKAFVIEVRPQSGPRAVETYTLSSDGKHLLEELRLGGGDFPAAQLKRVYDHSDRPLPRSLPTSD